MPFIMSHCLNRLPATVAMAGLLAIAAPTARANLIQNGGFETGSFSSWTQTGNAFMATVPLYGSIGSIAADGNYTVVLNAGDSPPNAVLSQTIATIAGTDYVVSFDYGSQMPRGFQSITASAMDNNGGGTLNAIDNTATTDSAFATTTFTFRADSAATTISFADDPGNYTYSNDGFIDNISVSDIPEPTSLALLVTGLVGATLRRRRRTA